jgi:hypothetical protein
MFEFLTIDLDGYRFQGVFDPLDPCRPAMVLLQSALEVLGFIRRDLDDDTSPPPLTHTVVVCPPDGDIYKARQVEALTLEDVREAIKTKKQKLEEWRNDGR